VAVLLADDNGRYILTNALASEMTGYSAEELRRLSVWQLTPGTNEHEAETLRAGFDSNGHRAGAINC
jgi:PAS domain S-box-containing protein